jgi:WD40 repeat protein
MRHLALALSLFACASDGPPVTVDEVPVTLATCAEGEGTLAEVWRQEDEHGAIRAQAVSPARQAVAVAGADMTIKLWNLDAEEVDWSTGGGAIYGGEVEGAAVVTALGFSADGATVVSGDESGALGLLAAGGGSLGVLPPGEEPARITSVAADATGSTIAFTDGSFSGRPRLWAPATGAITPVTTALWEGNAVGFLPDGALVTAGHYYSVPLVEVHAGETLSWYGYDVLESFGVSRVRAVAFSSDGTHIVAVGEHLVAVLDRARLGGDEAPESLTVGATLDATAVALLPGDRHFVTTGRDRMLRLWSVDGAVERLAHELPAVPAGVAVDATGERLIVAGEDGVLRILACMAPAR